MSENREWKIGDRVAHYSFLGRNIGSVESITSIDGFLFVSMGQGIDRKSVYTHRKQCRRLVQKARWEFWLTIGSKEAQSEEFVFRSPSRERCLLRAQEFDRDYPEMKPHKVIRAREVRKK